MWILLVEDEKLLAHTLKRGLEDENHVVDVVFDGEEAELQGLVNDYDVVLLDWRLPKRDGMTILRRWRSENREFPVMILTSFNETEHKITGLDAGADDYLVKPFEFEELLARVRALGRRSSKFTDNSIISLGPIEVDLREHRAAVCGIGLALRSKEFLLLELLLNEPGKVYSKTQIAERVWGTSYYVSDNTIEATISTLRLKMSDAISKSSHKVVRSATDIIQTVRGAGYKIRNSWADTDIRTS